MKKIIMNLSLIITVLLVLIGALRCHSYYHFASEQTISFPSSVITNDTMRVIIIGDSWAAYHQKSDSLLQKLLIDKNREPVIVSSNGIVGAKSKAIYQELLLSYHSLLKNHPNYAVISAGINDAVAKMGTDFYVWHYMLIIRQLLKLGIKPVVMEVPEVNYRAIASRERWTMRLHHFASSLMTSSELYGFESYRLALKNAIADSGLSDSLIYLKVDEWNPDGYRDSRNLYLEDETHLNDMGYSILDSCLANRITRDYLDSSWKY